MTQHRKFQQSHRPLAEKHVIEQYLGIREKLIAMGIPTCLAGRTMHMIEEAYSEATTSFTHDTADAVEGEDNGGPAGGNSNWYCQLNKPTPLHVYDAFSKQEHRHHQEDTLGAVVAPMQPMTSSNAMLTTDKEQHYKLMAQAYKEREEEIAKRLKELENAEQPLRALAPPPWGSTKMDDEYEPE
eukprot:TRINITY_DN89726_c0_g1_i1.p1 TRINITY_DN89726_c0_g1~~TRINITY_DN89726_c0_g1_i1.p1  ORF type:complete len:197 (+),score=29.03 TRINITY_DN89726_c0_g1_i1:42-593(+)